MNPSKQLVFGHTNDRPVYGNINFASESAAPMVVFCHGFKGFKDWGSYPAVADYFAENGVHFARFNFSHNGGTYEQPIDFPDLEAFGQNNFSKESSDLDQVITYLLKNKSERISAGRIHLLAHSRGTATALLIAEENAAVASITTWAGVSTIGERMQRSDLKKWKNEGKIFTANGRTKQQMPLEYQFYEDYLENAEKFDLCRIIGSLSIPQLIVYAEDDTVVPPIEAERMMEWNNDAVAYQLTSGGHTFGAKHPAPSAVLPEELKAACDRTIQFVKKN